MIGSHAQSMPEQRLAPLSCRESTPDAFFAHWRLKATAQVSQKPWKSAIS
jgi:hypothetical protein